MTSADFCRLMRLLILALHGVVLMTIMRQVGCTALQVLFDVAGGIANAAKRDIAHRDITPNNFGQLDGRGYLYDFSAAKVSSIVNLEGLWLRASPAKLSVPNKKKHLLYYACVPQHNIWSQ